MKNDLFSVGPFTVHGYGLMIAIGIIAAYYVGEYRAKKQKINPDYIMSFVLWTVGGGLVGAKILYYITELPAILKDPSLLLNISDGFVVFGGIIAGIFTANIYCRVVKISFFRYFDLLIPSVALGQAFGRIGCFLAGCCYGIETDLPIGIVFTNSGYAPNGVKLMPTQLMSSALDLLNFLFLLYITKKKKGDGQVLGCYLVTYSIGRFFLEFFRGDLIRGSVGVLSTSQFIAIFVCLAGLILIKVRSGKYEEMSAKEKSGDDEEIKEPTEQASESVENKEEREHAEVACAEIEETDEQEEPASAEMENSGEDSAENNENIESEQKASSKE